MARFCSGIKRAQPSSTLLLFPLLKIRQGMEETVETQFFSLVPGKIQSVCNYIISSTLQLKTATY